jgi:hypothetical protein
MTTYKITCTFTEPMLGTAPTDEDIYKNFVVAKRLRKPRRSSPRMPRRWKPQNRGQAGKGSRSPGRNKESNSGFRPQLKITKFHGRQTGLSEWHWRKCLIEA